MNTGLRVFVVGTGGRASAIAYRLAQSPLIGELAVAPGNGGTPQDVRRLRIAPDDISALQRFADGWKPDLTVFLDDEPLALGAVDKFRATGLRVFGPTRSAAKIEWSKAYATHVKRVRGIPSPPARMFTSHRDAQRYVRAISDYPLVIKVDGLAGGKGVYICESYQEARTAIDAIMRDRLFGGAGDRLLVEQYAPGREFSVHALCSGDPHRPLIFPASQDYKRIGDGDTGPNTGGMGAVAPLPWVTLEMMQVVRNRVVLPILKWMADESHPFTGLLYPGMASTPRGLINYEFNARFGDPEAQVYMMLLQNDLLALMLATTDGTLAQHTLSWRSGFAACVVLASHGYPGTYETGVPIHISRNAPVSDNAQFFHAGTQLGDDGTLVTTGGRVMAATAWGPTLQDAVADAYDLARHCTFSGVCMRSDIGGNAT